MKRDLSKFRFYSYLFDSWCRPTTVFSDKHWWFVVDETGNEMKAETRLSYFLGQEDQRDRQDKKIQERMFN